MDFNVLSLIVTFQPRWALENAEQNRPRPIFNTFLSGIDYPYLAWKSHEPKPS
jgi:hypothetical protein